MEAGNYTLAFGEKLMAQDSPDGLPAYLELCFVRSIPPIFLLFTVELVKKVALTVLGKKIR